ncbi:MAG: hypothetical protein DSY70_04640 [Desulfobulbus sp.]|nr:MAG: hypothetical protein DSY70_04640 [Desulfobulbus sp.]
MRSAGRRKGFGHNNSGEKIIMADITLIPGIGERTAEMLTRHGFTTVAKIAGASVDSLMAVPGFGAIRAALIIETAAGMMPEKAKKVKKTTPEKKGKKKKAAKKKKKSKKEQKKDAAKKKKKKKDAKARKKAKKKARKKKK